MKKKFLTLIILLIFIFSFSANFSYGTVSTNTSNSTNLAGSFITNEIENSTPDSGSDSDVSVYADGASLLDVNTGKFLYQKNADVKMYPASTTKLLTAVVVLESNVDLNAKAKVSWYAVHSVPYTYSIANLYANEEFTIKDLLYSLLIASANDSAYVLAEYMANGGNTYNTDSSAATKAKFQQSIQTFANMMNQKAKEIGCTNSNFVNPNGIHNENHYSTANDLALIGRYAYNMPSIMSIVGTTEYSMPHTELFNKDRNFKTTNLLLRKDKKFFYQYANGLKTGYTDAAKYCMIASAKKDDRSLVAVVLHSDNSTDAETSREKDCIRLFDYGFTRYTLTTLMEANGICRTLKIINGTRDTKTLNIYCKDKLSALIKTGEVLDVTPEVKLTKFLAPIARGEVVGTVSYNIDGINYSSDLIAEHDVVSSSYSNMVWALVAFLIIVIILLRIVTHKKSYSNKRKSKHSSGKRRSSSRVSNSSGTPNYSSYYSSTSKSRNRKNKNRFKNNRKGHFNHNKYL